MKKKIGFVECPEFRRLPAHIGSSCAWSRLLPKPDFIVGCSAGAIASAAFLPWTEENFRRKAALIKNLKTSQIYSVPRSTELLGLLVALSPLLPLIRLQEQNSKKQRLLLSGLELALPLTLEATFVNQFLKKEFIFSNGPMRKLLMQELDFEAIFKSDIELEIMATDMETGQEVVFTNYLDGDQDPERFVSAILASARLSGRFPPEIIDGKVLGDAAVRSSMPLHRAMQAGCDVIFVFSYTPFQETRSAPENWIADISRANQITESEVARLTFENYQLKKAAGLELPDVFIIRTNEQLPELNFREFSKEALAESMNIGYRAVQDNLSEIERLLA